MYIAMLRAFRKCHGCGNRHHSFSSLAKKVALKALSLFKSSCEVRYVEPSGTCRAQILESAHKICWFQGRFVSRPGLIVYSGNRCSNKQLQTHHEGLSSALQLQVQGCVLCLCCFQRFFSLEFNYSFVSLREKLR